MKNGEVEKLIGLQVDKLTRQEYGCFPGLKVDKEGG